MAICQDWCLSSRSVPFQAALYSAGDRDNGGARGPAAVRPELGGTARAASRQDLNRPCTWEAAPVSTGPHTGEAIRQVELNVCDEQKFEKIIHAHYIKMASKI